jgi:cardiolipin synthase
MKAPPSATVDGNRLTALPGGAERKKALIRLIDDAKHSLRLLYYIYADDRAGRDVCAALERAAERGVAVRLILDGFGSSAPAEFFDRLKEKGGDVCRFEPHWGRRYLLRNHQKLALADERLALIGGFNIEDDYFDDAGGWRDLGLSVEGPAAARVASYFDALFDWTHSDRPTIRALRHTLRRFSEKEGAVRWLIGGPTRKLSPWAGALRAEMRRAARLDMIAAYFAPTPSMLRGIEGVRRRGGQARVLTAAKSDNNATIAAARHTYARLLGRGVRVFEYQARRLHTKLFVIDRAVHLGSGNFDVRSLLLNCELMLRVEDQGFADAMRGYFEGELAQAQEVTAQAHAAAGWLDRLRWGAAYFLVAVVDGNVTRRLNFGLNGR